MSPQENNVFSNLTGNYVRCYMRKIARVLRRRGKDGLDQQQSKIPGLLLRKL